MAQILDTYNNSKLPEKSASSQKIDFIKTKVGGAIAVKGFTSKALAGNTDYNLDEKVLSAARKGGLDLTKYTQKIKR